MMYMLSQIPAVVNSGRTRSTTQKVASPSDFCVVRANGRICPHADKSGRVIVEDLLRVTAIREARFARRASLACAALMCVSWRVYKFNVLLRDGSYGLLRRPIRTNMPLIRHTHIIRKRIFAILGGTLGLHQPPSNHHESSPQPPELYNASW